MKYFILNQEKVRQLFYQISGISSLAITGPTAGTWTCDAVAVPPIARYSWVTADGGEVSTLSTYRPARTLAGEEFYVSCQVWTQPYNGNEQSKLATKKISKCLTIKCENA